MGQNNPSFLTVIKLCSGVTPAYIIISQQDQIYSAGE